MSNGLHITQAMIDLIIAGDSEVVVCERCGAHRISKLVVEAYYDDETHRPCEAANLSSPCECGEEVGWCVSAGRYGFFTPSQAVVN